MASAAASPLAFLLMVLIAATAASAHDANNGSTNATVPAPPPACCPCFPLFNFMPARRALPFCCPCGAPGLTLHPMPPQQASPWALPPGIRHVVINNHFNFTGTFNTWLNLFNYYFSAPAPTDGSPSPSPAPVPAPSVPSPSPSPAPSTGMAPAPTPVPAAVHDPVTGGVSGALTLSSKPAVVAVAALASSLLLLC